MRAEKKDDIQKKISNSGLVNILVRTAIFLFILVMLLFLYIVIAGPIKSDRCTRITNSILNHYVNDIGLEINVVDTAIYWSSEKQSIIVDFSGLSLAPLADIVNSADEIEKIEIPDLALSFIPKHLFSLAENHRIWKFGIKNYSFDLQKLFKILSSLNNSGFGLKRDKREKPRQNILLKSSTASETRELILKLKKSLGKYLYLISHIYFENVYFQIPDLRSDLKLKEQKLQENLEKSMDKSSQQKEERKSEEQYGIISSSGLNELDNRIVLSVDNIELHEDVLKDQLRLKTRFVLDGSKFGEVVLFLNLSSDSRYLERTHDYKKYSKLYSNLEKVSGKNLQNLEDVKDQKQKKSVKKNHSDMNSLSSDQLLFFGKVSGLSYDMLEKLKLPGLDSLDMLFDFWFKIYAQERGIGIGSVEFVFDAKDLLVKSDEYLSNRLKFRDLSLLGRYDLNSRLLDIKRIHATTQDGNRIQGSFWCYLHGKRYQLATGGKDADYNWGEMNLSLDRLGVDAVYYYWPQNKGYEVKEWLEQNFVGGQLEKIRLKTRFNKDFDFDSNLNFDIAGSNVTYSYPQDAKHSIFIPKAHLTINNAALLADIGYARAGDIDFKKVNLRIYDMLGDFPYMKIQGLVSGNLKSNVHLVIEHLYEESDLGAGDLGGLKTNDVSHQIDRNAGLHHLENLLNAKGEMESKVSLVLPLYKDVKDFTEEKPGDHGDKYKSEKKDLNQKESLAESDMHNQGIGYQLMVDSTISDFSLKDSTMLQGLGFSLLSSDRMNLYYNLDNNQLKVNGELLVDNLHKIGVNGFKIFDDDRGIQEKGSEKGVFDAELHLAFQELSLNAPLIKALELHKVFEGSLNGEVLLRGAGGRFTGQSRIDLTGVKIDMKDFKMNKAKGERGSIVFYIDDLSRLYSVVNNEHLDKNLDQDSDRMQLEKLLKISYGLNIPDLSSRGELRYSLDNINNDNKNKNFVLYSDSNHVKGSEFAFKYEVNKKGSFLDINGSSFDLNLLAFDALSDLTRQKQGDKSDDSGKKFVINVKLQKLLMKNNRFITKPSLQVICNNQKCHYVDLKGVLGDMNGYFSIFFNYPVFAISSNNAGYLLQSLGVYSNMRSGMFDFRADVDSEYNLKGKLLIDQFRIVNAPIVSELFKLAGLASVSLGDIFDILNLGGMNFDRMNCDILLENDLLNFNRCDIRGKSLIISGGGGIDYKKGTIDLKGFLSPVNFVDNLINFLKHVFNSDQGACNSVDDDAVNFNIHGNVYGAVSLNVNPFSVLAPSIFGKIFASKAGQGKDFGKQKGLKQEFSQKK